ncbi:12418_t:CDS:2 [Cetraspora pellucida]|uniref:12418_t:CDS:1 n=1 Tax=Cetraspora pellucida TaxID=1433469 RepID=A0A9N9IFH7_9GLOM|nr:12418_t:CDS:2 [Cetraspora pellucida]
MIYMNDLPIAEVKREKKLIELDKEERIDFEEALEDSDDKPLENIIENNTESITKESGVSKDDYNIQSVELIYDQFRSLETIDVSENFLKLLDIQISYLTKSHELKLKRLFNAFFLAIYPGEKNQQTKELLY